MLEIILTLAIATILFFGPALLIRWLARRPFYWTFNPANTFNIIVTDEDESGDGMRGGGNITNVLHAVAGKELIKISPDPMDWKFIPGEDPDHDAFLYKTLGVQSMGGIFYTIRLNSDKRMRFAREKDKPKEDLHTVTVLNSTKNIFYTGELTVVIKEADTADKLGINFEIDFAFERQFPVRSVLRLADSAAFLTSLVEKMVNSMTVGLPASAYIGGEGTPTTASTRENRELLIKAIEVDDDFSKKILDTIGFNITTVSLRDVTMTEAHRKLLELKVQAEKNAEAALIAANNEAAQKIARAKGDKEAGLLANDVVEDRMKRVIEPAAANELMSEVFRSDREAAAYENNKTVTTWASGSPAVVPLGR